MRANDEQDPLDRWLDQQVQPLPPPPGTFELIRRRARRRKVRKAVITVASAAAAAAAVAVAVPAGLALRPTPPPAASEHIAAPGSTPSVTGGTHTAEGKATPEATPTPASAPASEIAGPSGPPVPANFAPSSVTFVSTNLGWAIGQAGTPGHCQDKNPDICTSIVRTDNAGKSWVGGPAPKTTGPNGPSGVSGIRFLEGRNGWAFGPELWATHDGGQTWTQVNTGGQRVTDLETAGNRAYALWARCTGTSSSGFADGCTSYTLMTTLASSDNWTPVGGATSGLTNQGATTSGMITLTKTTGYLAAPDGTLYSGPLDGSAWQKAGTLPCQPGTPQANGLPAHALLTTISPTRLAAFCGPSLTPTTPPKVYTSTDSGALWTESAADWTGASDHGLPVSFTAAPDGVLIMATTTGIYRLAPGGAHWRPVNVAGQQAPSGGFSYVGMTTSEQGVAIPADTSLHEIWMTFDGGDTWAPATPITPGN